MAKEFKTLLGSRIYVEIPEIPESTVILDEEAKKAKAYEHRAKLARLKVYAVGTAIDNIKEGDLILIDPSALQKCPLVEISDKKNVLLVSPFDVIHIW
jgi:hypothetical protein